MTETLNIWCWLQIGNINLGQDGNKWIVLVNVFCLIPMEEGSQGLRKKTNQMEKSVSWGPLCPVHAHRKHTRRHTHSALSGLSSLYITYEFWHAALDGWQKVQSFVCLELFLTSHTFPQQACLEVQASKSTHTYTLVSFCLTTFFFISRTSSSSC